jgi:tRNA threonylcarbamoyl adenosine modification protein YeaZ
MKYGLGIHTSSPELGLVINNFNGEMRCNSWDLGRDLSSLLHEYLADFLQPQIWSDLEFIAVAKGPGSFTGTRMGVVTARTLGQQLNIPVFTVSSLAAIAHDSMTDSDQIIAVQMPAQRGQFFVAIYEQLPNKGGLKPLLEDRVMNQEDWLKTLENFPRKYDLYLNIEAGENLGKTVASMLELARIKWQNGERSHWSDAIPYYGQSPV